MPLRTIARVPRWAHLMLVLSLASLGAGVFFGWAYALAQTLGPPKVSPCVRLMDRTAFKEQELYSGYERHSTPDGDVVYLREDEDKAVRCAYMFDVAVGKELAAAYGATDPAQRAKRLLELAEAPRDSEKTRYAVVLIARTSLGGLPKEDPAVQQARRAIDQILSCQFGQGLPCPYGRPGPPPLAYLALPGALGLLVYIGLWLRKAWSHYANWYVRRQRRKAHARRTARTQEATD